MLNAVIIYSAVAMLMTSKNDPIPLATLFANPVVIALYAVAAALFVAAWFVPRLMPASGNPLPRLLVGWAMFEGVAVIGLVAALMTGAFDLFVGPMILALAGLLLTFPSARRLEPAVH